MSVEQVRHFRVLGCARRSLCFGDGRREDVLCRASFWKASYRMPLPFQFGRVKSAFGGEEEGVVPGEEVGEL